MTNFPASLDSFLNPVASTQMDAAGYEHDTQHANLNDAVAALQAKVGITGSGDVNSLDYKIAQLFGGGDAQFKIVNDQLCLWDSGQSAYVPLTCVNGVLGVGAPI